MTCPFLPFISKTAKRDKDKKDMSFPRVVLSHSSTHSMAVDKLILRSQGGGEGL